MSPTTKVLVAVGISTIAKIAIFSAIGHTARKQLRKTNPEMAKYFDR